MRILRSAAVVGAASLGLVLGLAPGATAGVFAWSGTNTYVATQAETLTVTPEGGVTLTSTVAMTVRPPNAPPGSATGMTSSGPTTPPGTSSTAARARTPWRQISSTC